jgi:hypothetical protein
MGRFSSAELRRFRDTSHCSACVHYSGCALWLSILLMNEELSAPGLDLIVPDLSRPCPMFFAWSSASAQKHTTGQAARVATTRQPERIELTLGSEPERA